jgi:YVTN family beta-propeller protein
MMGRDVGGTPDIRAGSELAGYRVESLIGRGGMGVVYLAEHLRLKRKVALKVLAPELASDERFRERFLVEAELAASLEHPNIVPIHDAGEADGVLYLAMRLVEGTDLKTLIEREGPLAPDRAASIVGQVASALDAAHAKGLIHRDVKPANVLLGAHDHAYLTDFGLTKRPDQTTGLTKTGQFMGSVDYAAPEQFEGKPLDARTDVYSLACVAYECLTGEVPFRRDQEAAVMYAHLREAPPRPSASRPELPPVLDGVISRGMAKRPEDRYRSAGGFATALRSAAGLEPRPAELVPKRPRGRRALFALGSAIAVVAVLAAILVSRGSGSPAPGSTVGSSPPSTAPTSAGPGVVRIDPATNTASASVHLDVGNIQSLTAFGGAVWVATSSGIEKVNPATNTVVAHIATAGDGNIFATSDEGLWELSGFCSSGRCDTTIERLDPRTNEIVKTFSLKGVGLGDIAVGGGSIWSPDVFEGPLRRMDERTGRVLAKLPVQASWGPPETPHRVVAVGAGGVWVLDGPNDTVTEIDPATNAVAQTIDISSPSDVAVDRGIVWVTSSDTGMVIGINPATGAHSTIRVGGSPAGVAVGLDSVWVADPKDGTVIRIDSASERVVDTIQVGGNPRAITVGEGAVWVIR